MKRSEAIKLIKEELEGKPIGENWAEQILIAVEKIGMLPPHNGPIGIGDFEEECTSDHVSDCQWEPEGPYKYTNKDFAGW